MYLGRVSRHGMKAAEPKSVAGQKQKAPPFFSKGSKENFFGVPTHESFFPKNIDAIQEKLVVGEPDDRYEKEADSMADQLVQRLTTEEIQTKKELAIQTKPLAGAITPVVQAKVSAAKPEEELQKKEEEEVVQESPLEFKGGPTFNDSEEPPPDDENNIQRKCAACEKEEKLQAKSNSSAPPESSSEIENTLNASKGGGAPIANAPRQQMEESFGTDFSNVRVHTDSTAAQMNKALQAQAFTHGSDVYFNSGKYNTESTEGKHLLAHELTHTVQQGESVRRKAAPNANNPNQKETAAEAVAPSSSEVVDISTGQFSPSEKVKAEIQEAAGKGLDVRVVVPNISDVGKIKIRIDSRGNYQAVGGQRGYMPVLNPWAQQMGGLYLRFTVKNNEVTGGFVSPSLKGGNPNEWIRKIQENAALLGGLGLKVGKLPKPVNEFSANSFRIGFTEGQVEVGGILDAKFNFFLENGAKPKIDGTADVNVKGVAKGQLVLDNTKDKLTGEVSLAIEFKNFTGNVTAKYNEDGSIDIHGKGAYSADKLSGEINFVATDTQSANNFAKDAIKEAGGKENVQNASPPEAAPLPKEGKKDRALAAVGQLQFHLTEWFAGTVNVIVDGKGDVTVIGRIAPPAEVELFKQKDYDKEIISLKVEAGYGIPVVGTIGVFAGVSLSAVAYIGPAKLYNIEILGTYSTDPEVQKNIQIAGSINISAYAGLRLRAEGGAKLTILSHDLKLGVGVNADVGVKAYADARPTIGYRDPGEFYISGTAQMVAQPMLGLSGDFFIEIDTPWWSPIDDDRWVWPIGSMEWPLSDPIGLNATMKEYVLGSGTAPDITFEKPAFEPEKFLTKMVDKELPDKTGADKGGKGEFKEDGTVVKPDVPDPNAKVEEPGGVAAPGKEPSKLKDKKKKAPPDAKTQQEAAKLFQDGAKMLESVKGPLSKGDLKKTLDGIEKSVPGIKYHIRLDGDQWKVTASAKEIDNPKPFKVSAIVTDEDRKEETKPQKTDTITAALSEIDVEGKKQTDGGEITQVEAEEIKNKVNADHPSVIKISYVKDGGASWDFEYVQLVKEKSILKNVGGTEKPPKMDPALDKLRGLNVSEKVINDIIAIATRQPSPVNFYADLYMFALNQTLGRDVFDVIINGLAGHGNFKSALFLMVRISRSVDVSELVKVFTLDDLSNLRKKHVEGSDTDFSNALNRIASKVDGTRVQILNLLKLVEGDPEGLTKLLIAIKQLEGPGKFDPQKIRKSLKLSERVEEAIAEGSDKTVKELFKGKVKGKDEDEKWRVAESLTSKREEGEKEKKGDLAPSFVGIERHAAKLLTNKKIDLVKWGVLVDAINSTDLPVSIKNNLIGRAWAAAKVESYEQQSYTVVEEVHIYVRDERGEKSTEYAKMDAVLVKGAKILYKEFKSSQEASSSAAQIKVYKLLQTEEGIKKLYPDGDRARQAFGGAKMPNFRPGTVAIEKGPARKK